MLLAEDEQLVREGVQGLLSSTEDISVVATASTGAEALDRARSSSPDILLLDLDMSSMSGMDVLHQLKSEELNVRVIVLTSYPEAEYALRALKMGVWGYLRKVVSFAELLEAVRTVAAGKRYITSEVASVLADNVYGTSQEPHTQLSEREYEVFRLLVEGRSVSEISDYLNLAGSTVGTYRHRVLEKLGLKSTTDLVHYAVRHNLFHM
ncbi:MAG: response regulator [Spirochaetota bacterium]